MLLATSIVLRKSVDFMLPMMYHQIIMYIKKYIHTAHAHTQHVGKCDVYDIMLYLYIYFNDQYITRVRTRDIIILFLSILSDIGVMKTILIVISRCFRRSKPSAILSCFVCTHANILCTRYIYTYIYIFIIQKIILRLPYIRNKDCDVFIIRQL